MNPNYKPLGKEETDKRLKEIFPIPKAELEKTARCLRRGLELESKKRNSVEGVVRSFEIKSRLSQKMN